MRVSDVRYINETQHFRSQGEKKHVMVFRVMKVSCDEEIDGHALEVEHAKLKVSRLNWSGLKRK